MRLRWICLAVCSALCAAVAIAADLPYICRVVPSFQTECNLGTKQWYTSGDFDGDGQVDFAFRHPLGLFGVTWRNGAPVALFQYNFPAEYSVDNRSPLLGPTADVTGDGRAQILYVVREPDPGSDSAALRPENWRFRVLDPQTDEVVCDIGLPQGQDVRADGRWDGRYSILGLVPDLAPSGGPLVLLNRVVGYDRYGRGVVALDARSGETVWHFETGPNPTPQCSWIGDLTGDGRPEIVFGSNSPANLGGEKVNGTSDDEASLFALDADGQLLWRRTVGGYFIRPYLAVADLTGNGAPEFAIATAYHGSDAATHDRLIVFAADGAVVAETVISKPTWNLKILPDANTGEPYLLLGSRAHHLSSYRLTDASLVAGPVAAETGDLLLAEVCDILPEPGDEILVIRGPLTDTPHLEILDQRLRVMAEEALPERSSDLTAFVWTDGPAQPVLLYTTTKFRQALKFLPSPPIPLHQRAWVWATALLLVAAALLIGYLVQRRRGGAARAASERDLLRRLFQELAESSHGTLAATRGVERLAWLLESHATNGETTGPVFDRLQAGLADFRDTVEPRLREILALAVRHEATVAAAAEADAELKDFTRLVRSLEDVNLDSNRILDALEGLQTRGAATSAGFRILQENVAARFGADAREMAERLLAQWPEGLGEVEVRFVEIDGAPTPRACVDPADLRFVLENLIGNALRAMADTPAPNLTIRTGAEAGRVIIEVTDNGSGVAEADRRKIFEAGFSNRADGGLGLARSREILAFWRGRLELLDSEPGVGSTFRIEIPPAREMNRKD